jgi:arylsulfatase A-like enzyme
MTMLSPEDISMTRTRERSKPGDIRIAWLCALLFLCACTPAPDYEAVAQRLDASWFEGIPVPLHGPVAVVGDEARTVVAAPEEILAAEAFGAVPDQGLARTKISLDPRTTSLPDSAFRVEVQDLPIAAPLEQKILAKIARENFSRRLDRGWTLRRPSGARDASLEIEWDSKGPSLLNLRLIARLPPPERLLTRAFALPDRSRIQLGFGLDRPAAQGAPPPTEFIATLSCAGSGERELFREEVLPSSDGTNRWRDFFSEPLEGARECRLKLEARASGENLAHGAVWSVPKIFRGEVRTPADRNLILISLDTLRAASVSGLGYARDTTPKIDAAFVDEGTTFSEAMSTFPQTDVSHLSIFTGLFPAAQPERGRVRARDRLVLLAELLQSAGLETAAFTENALVSGALGFWFGFDRFTERHFDHADRGRPTMEDGIRYVCAQRDRRFFLFLHTYKTHDPFVPAPAYEELFPSLLPDEEFPAPDVPAKYRELVDRYDRTIREADDLVGELLDALTSCGVDDKTIIIVTSDHGEAFGEHGIAGHGFTPHQEALHVPLFLRGPGIPRGKRIDEPVSIADLTPTILQLMDLPPPAQSQGRSLVDAMEGMKLPASRPLFYSWLRPQAAGVRLGTTKLNRTDRGVERFDLTTDPMEKDPIRDRAAAGAALDVLEEHERASESLRTDLGPAETESDSSPRAIDEDLERSLKALGYL